MTERGVTPRNDRICMRRWRGVCLSRQQIIYQEWWREHTPSPVITTWEMECQPRNWKFPPTGCAKPEQQRRKSFISWLVKYEVKRREVSDVEKTDSVRKKKIKSGEKSLPDSFRLIKRCKKCVTFTRWRRCRHCHYYKHFCHRWLCSCCPCPKGKKKKILVT